MIIDKNIEIKNVSNVIFFDNNFAEKKRNFIGKVPCNELIFKLSGETKIQFDDEAFYDKEGSLRFLPKLEKEVIYTTETIINGTCIDIFFDTTEPINCKAFSVVLDDQNLLKPLFLKADSSWRRKEDGFEYEVKGYLYQILAVLLSKNSYISKDKYQKILPGIEYIHQNFTSNFPVDVLGDMCSVSYSYFKKLFISKYGMSPKEYILKLRINQASDILKTDLYSVSAVSEMLGYQNAYYFSRSFKKIIGVSPSEYKKEFCANKHH